MTTAEHALVVRDLRKRYSQVEALKGISMTLPRGEIWGLLGPNGSGKSTFLKCVAGLVKPDGGEIQILGETPSRRTKAQIAFVPEVESLYLMSGGYDFTVILKRATMKEIAAFVSSKLAVIDEVQSTATHIVLVRYKDHGTSFIEPRRDMRMVVTP